jgi:hypothetical protein
MVNRGLGVSVNEFSQTIGKEVSAGPNEPGNPVQINKVIYPVAREDPWAIDVYLG